MNSTCMLYIGDLDKSDSASIFDLSINKILRYRLHLLLLLWGTFNEGVVL